MSGGSLDYFYFNFDNPLTRITKEVKWGKNRWTPETLMEFQKGIKFLNIARIYLRRIEWLLSGDDGEDSFHERLKEEISALEANAEKKEPRLQKCSLCKNFDGKICDHQREMQFSYYGHPELERMDKENYKRRLTDASDCWEFEEIEENDE